jgi:hypothetical protein
VFSAPLHRNGSYSIVACVFVAAGMCLPSRCIAINVYSNFATPTFGSHVTVRIVSFYKIIDTDDRRGRTTAACNVMGNLRENQSQSVDRQIRKGELDESLISLRLSS